MVFELVLKLKIPPTKHRKKYAVHSPICGPPISGQNRICGQNPIRERIFGL